MLYLIHVKRKNLMARSERAPRLLWLCRPCERPRRMYGRRERQFCLPICSHGCNLGRNTFAVPHYGAVFGSSLQVPGLDLRKEHFTRWFHFHFHRIDHDCLDLPGVCWTGLSFEGHQLIFSRSSVGLYDITRRSRLLLR